VLTQIVEQAADVGVGAGQECEPVALVQTRQHEKPARELQHCREEVAPPRTLSQMSGVLSHRSRQGRHGFRLQRGTGGVVNRQPVVAHEQRGLDSAPAGETLHQCGQTGHHNNSDREGVKGVRNVGAAAVEVKKRTEVDPPVPGA
jgi:hypothetical protein